MEQVKALTHGRGADYTMEAATLASAFPQTIGRLGGPEPWC